ncbi:MAG: hypothetical protein HY514_01425 [Candidatus Aenigmarchaeota archaeon]|nr:hypothetical protein [Candidatus Aenigmarchaeota archaeon]
MLDKAFSAITDAITHIDFYGLILPLLIYTLLIAVYGIFIWAFYKSISKRDLFHMEIKDHRKQWQIKAGHTLKYIILFPLLIFLWFAALTIILFFLSKSQSVQNILLMSMAMIAAARISAYYKESLSEDIAKILPLAVLAIFVVDSTFFSLSQTLSRFYEATSLTTLLVNYLLFTIILEFVLRVLLNFKQHFNGARKKEPIIQGKSKKQKKGP